MAETELLTPRECAAYRRCSLRTLDRERAEGFGPRYVRIGTRIFYRRGDVDQWIESHLVGGDRGDTAPEPVARRSRPRKSAQPANEATP